MNGIGGAEQESNRAIELNPSNATARQQYGQYLLKVPEFNPDYAAGHGCLGQVYEALGMYQQALAELRKAVELTGDVPMNVAALVF
jgi:tetratricopeptide (TPR) repeat protein